MNNSAKRILGYSFLIIAFISFKLCNVIAEQFLSSNFIFILAFIFFSIGCVFVIIGSKNRIKKNENFEKASLDKLRSLGEKIILTNENCKVVENNYYEEITNNNINTATVADSIYDPNRNVKQVFVLQSAIIYYYETAEDRLKLTSQTFSLKAEHLIKYIKDDRVKLYVDRFDKNKYAFVLD